MKILLTAQPAYGHLGPLLPLAHAATAAGHEVEVACAPSFAHAVGEAGWTPAPCGIDWTLTGDGLTATFPDLVEHPGNEAGNRFVIGTVFAERTACATAGDLLAAGAGHRYDVVVRETFELGGLLVAAAAGLPCAVVDRCDLVVCHAGFSTVLDALTAGVPMVLLPYSADQPENAARCAALGVAEVLPLLEMDPGSLRKAIDTVLADDRYAGAARTVRQEIEALPGTGDAVRLLEDLAAGRVPGT